MGKVRLGRVHVDAVVLAYFAALFGFPIAAAVVADRLPVDPEAAAPAPAPERSAPLQDLPAFSAGSALARRAESLLTDERRMGEALRASLSQLLGATDAAAAMRLVRGPRTFEEARDRPVLDMRLGEAPDRLRLANDVAALLVLAAAAEYGGDGGEFRDAPDVAFELLDRARRRGGCVPQRNFAFLMSTDPQADRDAVAAEFRRAERSCPRDPTSAWMLGQYDSREATADDRARDSATATFRRLQRQFPGSPLGWSGEADTLVRLGYDHDEQQRPFTARAHFRRALLLYRRAQQLDDDDPGLAAGAARALAGLREHDRAIEEQRAALAGRATVAALAVRQVDYLERDHRFGQAAAAARRLTRAHASASGRSLIGGEAFGQGDQEDTQTPLSVGVDRMLPVTFRLAPLRPPAPAGGAAGGFGDGGGPAAIDLSFIPRFEDIDWLTGANRWCPTWSAARDLLLSGRPKAALTAVRQRTVDLAGNFVCDIPLATIEAMAQLEDGHDERALAILQDSSRAHMYEMQQYMWRFAGDLGRADGAARTWLREEPRDRRAVEMLGEIAFLDRRFADAARWFARSARLARERTRGWSADEAIAVLKQGTALALAGRHREALAVLDRADDIATRARAADGEDVAAAFASYHARAQAGDTLLRLDRAADAAEAYAAAVEREPQLAGDDEDALARPEALHNNQAIAESKLGNHDAAIRAVDEALRADPESPVFLETKGHALRAAGRLAQAEGAYRAAVRSEPKAVTAWNDLGVVLARQDRLGDASAAFRRAVGVRSDYATGWFNLGIAEGRRGPRHALSSQGAFGRAFRADESLGDRRRRLIADDAVLYENLDLSKPLPPRSSYSATQERTPIAAAGFAVIVMLGLRLGRRLLASRFGGDIAGRLLDPLTQLSARFPRVPIYTPRVVAVLATVGVFASGFLRPGSGGVIDAIVLIVGVLALIALVARGRRLAARAAAVQLGQRGWTPGIAIGALAAAFGTAWAPLPVVEPDKPAPAVHWIGPVLTGIAALGLLILGAWLAIPGTLALAAVALVMTASLLTPTKPLDGGFVATGAAGLAVGFALLAGGLFFVLGLG